MLCIYIYMYIYIHIYICICIYIYICYPTIKTKQKVPKEMKSSRYIKREREQDGGGVGGYGEHLSPWIHQDTPSDTEVHVEHQLRVDGSI